MTQATPAPAGRRSQQHAGAITEHGDGLQLSSRRSARLNNYFLIVCHHDDLAAKVIRQRMRKTVYHVSFVPQIG